MFLDTLVMPSTQNHSFTSLPTDPYWIYPINSWSFFNHHTRGGTTHSEKSFLSSSLQTGESLLQPSRYSTYCIKTKAEKNKCHVLTPTYGI